MLPGIDRNEPHAPLPVTNGERRGDAVQSMGEYSDRWHALWRQDTAIVDGKLAPRTLIRNPDRLLPFALVFLTG